MKFKKIPIFIILTVLIGACTGFDPQAFVPGLYTDTPSVEETSTPEETATLISAPTAVKTVVSLEVCTGMASGKLHVRVAPGDSSDVRGYLLDGETVILDDESQTIGESQWQKLSSPIIGWVNAKYLCVIE